MDYIARVGLEIESQWARAHREEEAFPDIVLNVLQTHRPIDHLDPYAVAAQFLSQEQQATRQLAVVGAFGQPALTLYYGRGFVVDLYYWTHCLSAIHNHPFCGAFTLIDGYSLHSEYSYKPVESLGARMSVGTLDHTRVSLVKPGELVPFSLIKHPLVHTLLHVPTPAVSMVIRTVRTMDYLRYYPPGIALAMTEPDDFIARQLRLLELLRRGKRPEYKDVLLKYLKHSDLETAFRVWFAVRSPDTDPSVVDDVGELLVQRFGHHAQTVDAAIADEWRWQQVDALRAQYTEEQDRFLSSLLLCSSQRAHVFETLKAREPEADPVQTLCAWALETSGLFGENEKAQRVTARAMIETGTWQGVTEALRTAFPNEDVSSLESGVARWCEQSILAPLLVSP